MRRRQVPAAPEREGTHSGKQSRNEHIDVMHDLHPVQRRHVARGIAVAEDGVANRSPPRMNHQDSSPSVGCAAFYTRVHSEVPTCWLRFFVAMQLRGICRSTPI